MSYADYTFYQENYLGNMGEADFTRLSPRACAFVDSLTFRRGAALSSDSPAMDGIRMAVCAVADELLLQERGGAVTAVSNDGYSQSFAADRTAPAHRMLSAATLYLAPIGLLYAGGGR